MELGKHQESVTDDKEYEEDNQGKTNEVAFKQKNQFQSEKDRESDKNAKKDAKSDTLSGIKLEDISKADVFFNAIEKLVRLKLEFDSEKEHLDVRNVMNAKTVQDQLQYYLEKEHLDVRNVMNAKTVQDQLQYYLDKYSTENKITDLRLSAIKYNLLKPRKTEIHPLVEMMRKRIKPVEKAKQHIKNKSDPLGFLVDHFDRKDVSLHHREQGDLVHTRSKSIKPPLLPSLDEGSDQSVSEESQRRINAYEESLASFPSNKMESMSSERSDNEEEDVEILHTIICIDTSGSMRNQIQPIKRMITSYITDILRRNGRERYKFELPSIVCFGQKVSKYIPIPGIIPSNSPGFVEATDRTKQWVQNNVDESRSVGYGRTPLPEGLEVCLKNHSDVRGKIGRQLRQQHLLQSRVLMFSDGFPTAITASTSNVIEEDAPAESEIQIRKAVADSSKVLSDEKIPVYCVLISPIDSNQTMLTGMSDITKGNVILPEDVMVLGKHFTQKMLADDLSSSCEGLNWHQVVAYVMLRIKSRSFLYYELVAKLICEKRNIEICKNRHIAFHHLQRPLRKVLSKWQVKQNGRWEDYPIEVSNRLEEEFQKQRLTGLSSVYIEHSNTRFRIYFDEMKERHIGRNEERDVKRLILGEW